MGTEDAIRDFRARCAAMRDERATHWDGIVIELAPVESPVTSEEDAIQRSLKLEQQEKERRKVLRLAASGGPRPAGVRT